MKVNTRLSSVRIDFIFYTRIDMNRELYCQIEKEGVVKNRANE